MRPLAALPLCLLLGACVSSSGGGGLSNLVVEPYIARSFDAQIAPAVSGYCTEGEIATLRRSHIDIARATNAFDVEGVLDAGRRLEGLSPGCSNAYARISSAICRRQAIDSWRPGSEPYESALARARNCG